MYLIFPRSELAKILYEPIQKELERFLEMINFYISFGSSIEPYKMNFVDKFDLLGGGSYSKCFTKDIGSL